jgi:carbon monoxide dehydrogenase subunit G
MPLAGGGEVLVMGADFGVEIDVAVPAAQAWELVGDPCGVPQWYPLYISCTLDGNVRTLARADGAVLVEEMLTRDDDAMTYTYAVTDGLPLAEHEASFTVVPTDSGCRIAWNTHAVHEDPSIDMEERLVDRQMEALQGLRDVLEGRSG